MAELIDQLAGKLGIPVRARGALRLIRLEDCGTIVEACRSGGVLILGIEAFKLEGENVVPDSDLIADFSGLASEPWDAACLEALRSADAYFAQAKGRIDLWFDFSLRKRC